jgi:hypothetical protein
MRKARFFISRGQDRPAPGIDIGTWSSDFTCNGEAARSPLWAAIPNGSLKQESSPSFQIPTGRPIRDRSPKMKSPSLSEGARMRLLVGARISQVGFCAPESLRSEWQGKTWYAAQVSPIPPCSPPHALALIPISRRHPKAFAAICRLENRNLNGHPWQMAPEQVISNPEWWLFYARPIYGSGFRHQLTGCSADRSCVKPVRYSNDGYPPSSTRSIFCARKGNKAQGFRSQVLCAGRGRGGSHSIRRDYNVALHVHICRLSGRKPAARSSSFNGETLWRQFLYFGWSTARQRMAPTENTERKIVDGATNHYRRRARYGRRAESPDDAPAQSQSVETSGNWEQAFGQNRL